MDVLDFLELVEHECGGMRRHMYLDQITSGLRKGQAFMNALRGTRYYNILAGSDFDTTWTSSIYEIREAINYIFEVV